MIVLAHVAVTSSYITINLTSHCIPMLLDYSKNFFLFPVRFLYWSQWRDKISKYVHYPVNELNMSPYVVGDQKPKNYHLYAITVSMNC